MKALAFRLWPKSSQKLTELAKSAEEREVSLLREHPKLLVTVALSFLFGFGFLFVIGYFIYVWLKGRSKGEGSQSPLNLQY